MSIDKFYTDTETAKQCIELIPDFNSYDLIIEPSAGNGSFSKQLHCIAYDIEPEDSSIIQQDWFKVGPIKNAKHILVVGNPPFGPRSTLAKNFIRHSQEIGAETIAFILPDTFSKLTNQSLSLFPQNWKLIIEHKLSNCNFIINKNETYYVPCTFYVWTKRESSINLRQIKLPESKDFKFLTRGDKNADFSINGNSGKVKELNQITNPKAEHYIKALEKSADELKDIFTNLDYNFLSSVNGNNAWIGQQDILKAYYTYLKNNK